MLVKVFDEGDLFEERGTRPRTADSMFEVGPCRGGMVVFFF